MSCLQGYMTISYAELVEKLGPPNSEGDGYKVDAEWEFPTFTIYNYKTGPNYNKGYGSVNGIRDWHIGGNDLSSVAEVKKLFPNHSVRAAR